MDRNKLSDTGRAILLLMGQVIVIIACVGYIEYVYFTNILPDKVVSETYQMTDCLVTDEKMELQSGLLRRYRADFQISYTANNTQYSVWVSGNGLDPAFTTDRGSQEEIIQQFEVGQTYSCWFNPDAPDMVVLMLRHSWSSTFPLFIPSIILLIVIFYLARTVFHFLGEASVKTREKIRKRRKKIKEKKEGL